MPAMLRIAILGGLLVMMGKQDRSEALLHPLATSLFEKLQNSAFLPLIPD
jgi:hypothetical protein